MCIFTKKKKNSKVVQKPNDSVFRNNFFFDIFFLNIIKRTSFRILGNYYFMNMVHSFNTLLHESYIPHPHTEIAADEHICDSCTYKVNGKVYYLSNTRCLHSSPCVSVTLRTGHQIYWGRSPRSGSSCRWGNCAAGRVTAGPWDDPLSPSRIVSPSTLSNTVK